MLLQRFLTERGIPSARIETLLRERLGEGSRRADANSSAGVVPRMFAVRTWSVFYGRLA
jgi:hypothetical protein